MGVYIFLVISILIGTLIPMSKNKNKKIYCVFITILLIVSCGMRSKYMGPQNSWGVTDAENVHVPSFLAVSKTSITEIFDKSMAGDSNFRGIVACLFYKVISYISKSEQFFLFMCCVPVFSIMGRYIYKYSNKPAMSFMLLLGLNYYTGSMYMMRHMLAVSCVVLAFDFLYQQQTRKFVITVLVAGLIHVTALSVLAILPLRKVKWGIKHFVVIVVGLLIGLFGESIWMFVMNILISINPAWVFFIKRNLTNEFGQSWYIAVAILLCIVLRRKVLYSKDPYCTTLNVNLATIGCICYGWMSLLQEFSRIAMFFMPVTIVLLPNAISEFKGEKSYKTQLVASSLVYVAFGVYFLVILTEVSGAVPYRFYWQY